MRERSKSSLRKINCFIDVCLSIREVTNCELRIEIKRAQSENKKLIFIK